MFIRQWRLGRFHFPHVTVRQCAALCAVALVAGISKAATAASRPMPRFVAGADISLLTAMEQQGVVYKVDGKPVNLLKSMRANGYNCARLRLWVNPDHKGVVINDLRYTIALGKRVKQAGLLLMLDLHYSDTWADPHKQNTPTAWSRMTVPQLARKVHDYTRDVIIAMRKGGAMPDIVETGNEITGGMLWPQGKTWGPGHDFNNLAIFLKSARRGVVDGSGSAPRPLIMIHIDRGGDWNGTKWFFDAIRAKGVDYDILGESYYPLFHGPIGGLKETLVNAAARYHKPILVTETAYPFKDNGRPVTPGMTYPRTPQGQLQYVRDLDATVRSTPYGLGRGVLYWEPEWLPTKGLGGAWNTTALFDDDGNVLPAFRVYAK